MNAHTYLTAAGSKVKAFPTGRIDIDLDWFEEGLCIDCEPDPDMTRDTGFHYLMTRCDSCGMDHRPLHRFNPNKDTQPV